MKTMLRIVVLVLASASVAAAQGNPDWHAAFPAFKIAGNLYYVGTADLAVYLIRTPQGNILMNSDYESSVPVIKASDEKQGFKFSDIKILIAGHAHPDDDGSWAVARDGGPGRIVRVKDHPADPITVDQALLQMELVGHDFYLFNDADTKLASVVYRRRGFDYGLLRLT